MAGASRAAASPSAAQPSSAAAACPPKAPASPPGGSCIGRVSCTEGWLQSLAAACGRVHAGAGGGEDQHLCALCCRCLHTNSATQRQAYTIWQCGAAAACPWGAGAQPPRNCKQDQLGVAMSGTTHAHPPPPARPPRMPPHCTCNCLPRPPSETALPLAACRRLMRLEPNVLHRGHRVAGVAHRLWLARVLETEIEACACMAPLACRGVCGSVRVPAYPSARCAQVLSRMHVRTVGPDRAYAASKEVLVSPTPTHGLAPGHSRAAQGGDELGAQVHDPQHACPECAQKGGIAADNARLSLNGHEGR